MAKGGGGSLHAREYEVGDGSGSIDAVVPTTLLGALDRWTWCLGQVPVGLVSPGSA